ncbi:cation:proton antiporter [Bosea sp. (in: a-proteobacteria)]|uniref:cation:proton antiporter domain-containing protein n=1 Tax=Bosea sp. (in: a-proteobacteria) TaxID=1871050 RepID=UPI00260AF145|nr:cation:proton antiporter [Bosea sp. (in: a-proteobacteria)]MCO5092120.1 cation:proton antiporter [Bosea sp. (in: a-proteobacteria)]
MAGTVDPSVYKDAVVVLATAGVVVPLAKSLKVNSIIAFVACGVLLGPFGLGALATRFPLLDTVTVSHAEALAGPAELGVAFLLFVIGLELSFERLMTMKRLVFGLGLSQVGLCAAVIGLAAYALGQPAAAALIIGFGLALSSTAMVVELLAAKKRMMTSAGRASFSILLCQDLAVIPLLFLITVLDAQNGSGSLIAGLAQAFIQAFAAIATIVVIGRLALRPLFRLVAVTNSTESFMAATLLTALGTGLIAAAAGLSMGLGAFIAGLLLAETEFRRAIEVTIDPFKSLLIGVFFLTVGMGVNPVDIAAHPFAILGGAAGLVLVKTAIIYGLARGFRLSAATALETAIMVAPGGEFAFVLLNAATGAKLIDPHATSIVLAAVSLTMVALPLLARIARNLGQRVATPVTLPDEAKVLPPDAQVPRAIVVGGGRVGRLVGSMLDEHGKPHIVIDSDATLIMEQRRAGRPAYYGDATRPEFLRLCGLEDATALIVTLDNPRAVDATVLAARSLRPDLVIVARARDAAHARHLYEIGVNDAVPETIEASLQLSEAALVGLGVPMGLVIASVHERRDGFRAELKPAGAATARTLPRHARSRRL